ETPSGVGRERRRAHCCVPLPARWGLERPGGGAGRRLAMSANLIDVVVERKERLAVDALRVILRPANAASLPGWEPGAHIDVELPGSLVRQFSLCGDPADRSVYEIAVRREAEGRGGSAFVHDSLREGDRVRVSPPRNHFALDEADRYVFVAGGIGI